MAIVATEFDIIFPKGIIRFYEFLPIFAYLQMWLDKSKCFPGTKTLLRENKELEFTA